METRERQQYVAGLLHAHCRIAFKIADVGRQ